MKQDALSGILFYLPDLDIMKAKKLLHKYLGAEEYYG
jgi:hypothetical protein